MTKQTMQIASAALLERFTAAGRHGATNMKGQVLGQVLRWFAALLLISGFAAAQAQTATITSPTSGATYTAPANVVLTVQATPLAGRSITKVEFYNGATLLATDTTAPYSHTWASVPAGFYGVTAKVYDSANVVIDAGPVQFAVNALPTVSLTSPAAGSSLQAPATVTLSANAADSAGGSIAKVEFYNGATLLGTDTTAPYSYTWASVPAGSYSLTAKATDSRGGVATSSAVAISVVSNPAPTVSITAPANNSVLAAPATIALTANASDADGISKVEFYNGSTLLSADTTAPYGHTLSAAAAGSYSFTAKAYDSKGAVSTSSAVAVIVNALPSASISSPATGASFSAPASITINATAADSDGSISKVEFFNGSTLLGSDTTAPYSFTWSGVVSGSYSLTVKATDNRGAVTTSSAVAVSVCCAANVPPTVSITAPAANAQFIAPGSVAITATAADSDGSIAKVEFYNGATLLGTDTTAPYSFSWASVPAGTYSLTAKAFDDKGASTTSTAVPIRVCTGSCNALPTVSLTSPSSGASATAPASFSLTATAADSDGSIAKVEFYNGSTLLGSDTTAPYSFNWTSVPVGSYTLTAKATDNLGGSSTSSPVTVTVTGAEVAAGTLFFVHPDHLDTPRQVSDATGKIVWRLEQQEPFGLTPASEDPDADGKAFVLNLRFAGQYYDKESGQHYNINRDYDPKIGRYIQTDPTGLSDGVSLYGYVGGNPLGMVDPLGLMAEGFTRRVQSPGDQTFKTERAARREVVRQYGGITSQANNCRRIEDPDKNKNIRGLNNEKAEFLEFEDSAGNTVQVKHHKHGHRFSDNSTYEMSHYHGKGDAHISYGP